jgi:hypothetical protein
MPKTRTAGSQVDPELSDRWPVRFGVPLTDRVPAIGRVTHGRGGGLDLISRALPGDSRGNSCNVVVSAQPLNP